MNIKIFACHHLKPAHEISSALFQSMVSGMTPEPGSQVLTDLAGRNIATRERFCELRHQYYVWQNLLGAYDYVGFEHYRRLFWLNPLTSGQRARYPALAAISRECLTPPDSYVVERDVPAILDEMLQMRRFLNDSQIEALKCWIAKHDVLYTNPHNEPVDQNFNRAHWPSGPIWETLTEIMRTTHRHSILRPYIETPAAWSGYRNMFIMRSDLFAEYMEAIFPPLFEMERRFPNADVRMWGFLSERLLGPFLIHKAMEEPMLRMKPILHVQFARAKG
jgi:hypothetical protein